MAYDMKILVVDDEPIVTQSVERVLTAEGYTVESAAGGRDAARRAERNHYDLVMTDLKMPDMDGISLLRWMRKHRPSTGVVLMTGYPSQETMQEAIDYGIIDYVPKPFTPEVLKGVLGKATDWIMSETLENVMEKEIPDATLAELDRVIDQYKGKAGSTIPVLQRAQELVGYLPPSIQRRIARRLNVYPAEIHSIVSFYSFFTMIPRGQHTIRVCLGTACYVKGIEPVLNRIRDMLKIDVGETTEDRRFTLEAVRCVGACGLAPVMVVDQDTHGALTQTKAMDVINSYSATSTTAPLAQRGCC